MKVMNVVARVRRTGLASVVLCGLAIALTAGSIGPLLGPGFALAAEDDAEPDDQADAGDNADAGDQAEADDAKPDAAADSDATADAPNDAEESEEIFVPSEDISEDNDVPFPVDI